MTKRVEGLPAKWDGDALFYQTAGEGDKAAVYTNVARDLREALAADRAEAGELPELPAPHSVSIETPGADFDITYFDSVSDAEQVDDELTGLTLYYTADQLRTYGQQCARAASCGGGEWPSGVLNRKKTLDTLRSHNEWRRGAEAPQTDPRILGLALDAVIAYLTTPPTPSAGVEVPAWVTELVEAAKAVVEADWFLPVGKFVSANANDPLEWSEEVTWLIEACNKLDLALTAASEGGK